VSPACIGKHGAMVNVVLEAQTEWLLSAIELRGVYGGSWVDC
jgi:hypothetical protein